jgi:hypothetical protein
MGHFGTNWTKTDKMDKTGQNWTKLDKMVILGQKRTNVDKWDKSGQMGQGGLTLTKNRPYLWALFNNLNFFVMAKLSSLFKFEGTVDDITVVKNSGVVKRKGGLSKERIATDPKLVRVRENNAEFAMLATASKTIRDAFGDLGQNIRVQYLTSRLSRVLTRIKNLDSVSARGYRTVAIGIQGAEGKNHLNGFSFNATKSISAILQKPYTLDTATGEVSIMGVAPAFDTLGGIGANTVGIKAYWAKIDFETNKATVSQTNQVKLGLDTTITDVMLTHAAPPAGTGIDVFVLSIVFYQTVNGIDYLLQNGAHNAADIIAIP